MKTRETHECMGNTKGEIGSPPDGDRNTDINDKSSI
jgi:hypothetical protein